MVFLCNFHLRFYYKSRTFSLKFCLRHKEKKGKIHCEVTMKKSIVLQATEGKEKAVLSMETKDDMILGRVRLYNFGQEPKGILSLGFNFGGKIVKAGMTKTASMLWTFQMEQEEFCDKFSCAVVNSFQGQLSPLLYGNSEGKSREEDLLVSGLQVLDKPLSAQMVENELDENNVSYDEDLKEEIETAIDKEFREESSDVTEDKCENCKYKKCFFEEEKHTFYNKLKNQLDRLFENNPEEEYLEKIIPNSKWVKVEYEKEGDYYVVGLVYQDNELSYLCYGVPGVYQKTPPKEIAGYPVWLPLDSDKREGFGYWLAYQNADTGESIKAIIE